MIPMPGASYDGELPPLTEADIKLREALRHDIHILAQEIGPRSYLEYEALTTAADFLIATWERAGFEVERQMYEIAGRIYENLIVEVPGCDRADEIVVIGSHYDSVTDCPGANDNGSGVAATVELALQLRQSKPARTLRFVLFVNEEPPFFQTDQMGSRVYAKQCRDRNQNIVAMISLETIGYFSDEVGSQQYIFPLGQIYPLQGNFIGFVSNVASTRLVRQAIGTFRRSAAFPSEGAILPGTLPGVSWSDHWSFWQESYPALMVTDTAFFRYPYYHTEDDTPDKVDFDRLTRVVAGLKYVILALANPATVNWRFLAQ